MARKKQPYNPEYRRRYYLLHKQSELEGNRIRDAKFKAEHPDEYRQRCAKKRFRRREKANATQRLRRLDPVKKESDRKRLIRWRKNNPKKLAAIDKRARDKRRATPIGHLNHNISNAVRDSLVLYASGDSVRKGRRPWQSIVGYTVEQLKAHLEAQFQPGMSRENYGEWHIDHRRALCTFTFSTSNDAGFQEAWALSNIQPLWAIDNLKKAVQDRRLKSLLTSKRTHHYAR